MAAARRGCRRLTRQRPTSTTSADREAVQEVARGYFDRADRSETQPDPATVAASLADVAAGRCQEIGEVIGEIKGP